MSVTFVVVSVVLLCFRPIFPFSSFQPFLFIGGFDSSALCRSRRELSNEYLLAKIGVDTAENDPLEVWGENSIQYSLHSLIEVYQDAAYDLLADRAPLQVGTKGVGRQVGGGGCVISAV